MNILVINAGSSSLKYQLMNPDTGDVTAKGLCERIGLDGRLTHKVPASGKKVEKALADLTFSKRRIAGDVKKCLQSAIANAENNHNLDVDSLVVAEAWVGKNLVMKRGRPRARGRFGKIMKPFSEITIKVRQVGESA